jgi:DNA-directed RNA polymerase specialized sigma subunit
VSSAEIAEALADYWPLFEFHARKFQGIGGAEFDDLVQEGALASFLAMLEGFIPSNALIQRAMLDWIRFISHRGLVYDYTTPLDS